MRNADSFGGFGARAVVKSPRPCKLTPRPSVRFTIAHRQISKSRDCHSWRLRRRHALPQVQLEIIHGTAAALLRWLPRLRNAQPLSSLNHALMTHDCKRSSWRVWSTSTRADHQTAMNFFNFGSVWLAVSCCSSLSSHVSAASA